MAAISASSPSPRRQRTDGRGGGRDDRDVRVGKKREKVRGRAGIPEQLQSESRRRAHRRRLVREERAQKRTAPLVADPPDRQGRSGPDRGIRRVRRGSEQALIEGAAVLELDERRLRVVE